MNSARLYRRRTGNTRMSADLKMRSIVSSPEVLRFQIKKAKLRPVAQKRWMMQHCWISWRRPPPQMISKPNWTANTRQNLLSDNASAHPGTKIWKNTSRTNSQRIIEPAADMTHARGHWYINQTIPLAGSSAPYASLTLTENIQLKRSAALNSMPEKCFKNVSIFLLFSAFCSIVQI